MSRIPSIGPVTPATNSPGQQPTDLRDLELDHFLQLLITELQNQDPLNPLDNSEILQQIGQIREIGATNLLTETLQSVVSGQNLTTASSLIGKEVTALSDDLQNVQGIVDRVSVEVDEESDTRTFRVHINGQTVSLDNVREIVGRP